MEVHEDAQRHASETDVRARLEERHAGKRIHGFELDKKVIVHRKVEPRGFLEPLSLLEEVHRDLFVDAGAGASQFQHEAMPVDGLAEARSEGAMHFDRRVKDLGGAAFDLRWDVRVTHHRGERDPAAT